MENASPAKGGADDDDDADNEACQVPKCASRAPASASAHFADPLQLCERLWGMNHEMLQERRDQIEAKQGGDETTRWLLDVIDAAMARDLVVRSADLERL